MNLAITFLMTSLLVLDPLSVTEHLAYYKVYPDTPQGKKALVHAWKLLGEGAEMDFDKIESLPEIDLEMLISLVTRDSTDSPPSLSPLQLEMLQQISSHLPNRKLKGSQIWTKEEILTLPDEEIDLGRALLIHQFENHPDSRKEIQQYEASIDLMALEIRARLTSWASDVEKIHAINRYIFEEKRFRFPPHSIYAKDIDLYTFLPSVLDSREGVCLGVSILYLTIAQRLNLKLEIVTPPGHIFLRYQSSDRVINIETTARGINIPTETYLGINTRNLQHRTIKEVIGLSFMNQASVGWDQHRESETIRIYEIAKLYLPDDPLLSMLLGFNYLFNGEKKKGKDLLIPLKNLIFDHAISKETIPEDYLNGKIDAEGIKHIFSHVDETRESIIEKMTSLEKVMDKHPHFRAGLMQLATCRLQLGHTAEALKILEKYHSIDPNDATVEYYLTLLHLERFDFNKAWNHFYLTEKLSSSRNHHPKLLRGLKIELLKHSPGLAN